MGVRVRDGQIIASSSTCLWLVSDLSLMNTNPWFLALFELVLPKRQMDGPFATAFVPPQVGSMPKTFSICSYHSCRLDMQRTTVATGH